MKILFIYPDPLGGPRLLSSKLQRIYMRYPVSAFKALESVTPPEYSIKVIDERLEQIDFEADCTLVGISAMTHQAPRAYAIADEFMKRGKKVVLGGWHPSALPDEAKRHANAVVIGEGEEIWPRLLSDVEHGRLAQEYRQEKPVDFSALSVERNLRMKRNFLLARPIEATRGCPYGCNFCAISNSTGYGVFHVKPVERVIAEIGSIPQRYLLFNDSSLTINVEYTKRLFRQMKGLNKKFYCFGNTHTLLKDDELLRLAYEAGCLSWSIGFDSINQTSLDGIGKHANKVEEYKTVIRKIHDHGMAVAGSFMVGFDTDTRTVFDDTLGFLSDSDIDSAAFHILTPLPGTPLFSMMEKQGRILTRDWSKYDCMHVVFEPKNMTATELINGYFDMYATYYTPSTILDTIGRSVPRGFYPLYISIAHSLQVLMKPSSSKRGASTDI
jgi:radical SAM superfamily enzyme YgiQ (UPF0313 family)